VSINYNRAYAPDDSSKLRNPIIVTDTPTNIHAHVEQTGKYEY